MERTATSSQRRANRWPMAANKRGVPIQRQTDGGRARAFFFFLFGTDCTYVWIGSLTSLHVDGRSCREEKKKLKETRRPTPIPLCQRPSIFSASFLYAPLGCPCIVSCSEQQARNSAQVALPGCRATSHHLRRWIKEKKDLRNHSITNTHKNQLSHTSKQYNKIKYRIKKDLLNPLF